ncbi:hypothetical protein [Thiohalobacter thiocyanaticus]|uniref:Uncharacterized protein n=1 Tax=Thiohalobacter thiocyanaticus TaxID=585455 RepID=A0A426QHB2_9GAMM|nr:hypothetical protein [Thiohalobacter thiocyanaticus]RRQ21106.1 hypothetical protein D6C00_03450 [Thiohalobacter thiocyanaticus]
MRQWLVILLVTGMLLAGGCSVTPSRDTDILSPVTRAGTEYEQARELYAEDPAIIDLYRDRLVELSLTLAQHRRQEGEWYAAERTLEHALTYLPEHDRLQQALDETARQRQAQMQHTRDQALAAEAQYELARRTALREQVRLQETDYLHDWRLSRNTRRLEALAEPLRNCARRNLERDALELAERCLELAGQIRGEDFVQDTLQALQARRTSAEQATTEVTAPAPAPAQTRTTTSNNNRSRNASCAPA